MRQSLKNALRLGVVLLAATALTAPAFADPVADPFQILADGGAGPLDFAILGLGAGNVSIGVNSKPDPTIVTGNVGIGAGPGMIENGTPTNTKALIKGSVVTAMPGQYDPASPGTVTGSIGTNPTALATAVAAATNASKAAKGMAATMSYTSFTLGQVITGVPGINVINLTGSNFITGGNSISAPGTDPHAVTFTGPAGTKFIINAPGNSYGLNESGSLLTAGGVSPTDVLFNFTNDAVHLDEVGGGSVVDGILLAPGINSVINATTPNGTLNLGWMLNGEAIGQTVKVYPDAFVTDPVPEPGSLAMLGTGLFALGLIGFVSRQRWSHSEAAL